MIMGVSKHSMPTSWASLSSLHDHNGRWIFALHRICYRSRTRRDAGIVIRHLVPKPAEVMHPLCPRALQGLLGSMAVATTGGTLHVFIGPRGQFNRRLTTLQLPHNAILGGPALWG